MKGDGVVKSLKAAVVTCALLVGVVAQATPAQATTRYWYNNPGSNPGANYLPHTTINGQSVQTYYQYGVWGNVSSGASVSGDYCNTYNMTPFSGYLDGNPYYYGDATSRSYCYAQGSIWGTNVNGSNGAGAQHFASTQGASAYPWATSFGANPSLYMFSKLGVTTNTSSQAWAYLCADLIDTLGVGDILEICADEWDWGQKNSPDIVGCFNPTFLPPALYVKPTALPVAWVEPANSAPPKPYAPRYFEERPQSSNTVTTKLVTRGTPFSVDITKTHLLNAIADSASCNASYGTNFSTKTWGYRLMGVEDGLELGAGVTGRVNGVEEGLVVATLY